MALRESHIITTMFSDVGEIDHLVYIADELITTSVYGLASITDQFLPYLFVGFFPDIPNHTGWFFANAQQHEQMKQAVEEHYGTVNRYSYGQAWFDKDLKDQGILTFSKLDLVTEISVIPKERLEILRKLVTIMNPDEIANVLKINLLEKHDRLSKCKWTYAYVKSQENFHMIK